jgi:hypothetical protein
MRNLRRVATTVRIILLTSCRFGHRPMVPGIGRGSAAGPKSPSGKLYKARAADCGRLTAPTEVILPRRVEPAALDKQSRTLLPGSWSIRFLSPVSSAVSFAHPI